MSTRFFCTTIRVYSDYLPRLGELSGVPCNQGAVLGENFVQLVDFEKIPKLCQEFFQQESAQMVLPFKEEK